MPDQPLRHHVAVVAGATRGAGRGIARMLGAAGATVYCTGRSVRGRPATPGRREMIEETAELVTAEGGRGIAVRTDHTVESDVEQLFARVRADAGRLDVLSGGRSACHRAVDACGAPLARPPSALRQSCVRIHATSSFRATTRWRVRKRPLTTGC